MDGSSLVDKCVQLLRREDVKSEFRRVTAPLLEMVLQEMRPYLYLSLILVIASFILHLGIFWMMLRRPRLPLPRPDK